MLPVNCDSHIDYQNFVVTKQECWHPIFLSILKILLVCKYPMELHLTQNHRIFVFGFILL